MCITTTYCIYVAIVAKYSCIHIPYTMKVSWQVVQADLCKKPSWNPTYFLLNPYLNSTILKFHIIKFHGHAKTLKTAKLFCLETFMVYGIAIATYKQPYKTCSYVCMTLYKFTVLYMYFST